MDELEISGKRYISSKRIAKENKYHSDYIGQLIRGGKIVGTKVGRAWYVEERSFADYLNKENKTYVAPTPVEKILPPQNDLSEKSSDLLPSVGQTFPQDVIASVEPITEVPQIPPMPALAEKETILPIKKEEVFIPSKPVISLAPLAVKKPALTYISDTSPLFPTLQKREHSTPVRIQKIEEHTPVPVVVHEKKSSPLLRGVGIVAVGALGITVLAFSFFGSLGLDSTVQVQQGQPASVSYAQENTLCFIFNTCQSGQTGK